MERYVRRNGIEGPLQMLSPGEFHADTTELVQMLRDGGHHNVRLDKDAWEQSVVQEEYNDLQWKVGRMVKQGDAPSAMRAIAMIM